MARDDAYMLDEKVWKNHIEALDKLVRAEVVVGVLGKSGSDLVKIAFWNHEGTRVNGKQHSPPRPFFDITEQRVGERKRQVEDLALARIQQGADVENSLKLVGAFLAGEVQETIAQLRDPPNKPSTISKKGHAKPLIGGNKKKGITGGRLRESISYTVRFI